MCHPRNAKPSRIAIFAAVSTVLLAVAASAQTPVTVNIDANANRKAISPNIYGVAFASTANLLDLNAPLNRMGGNDTSCYNWQVNGSNKGNDWYFESIADASATPGERGDTFIATGKAAGADSMIAIPMIGWVAKLGPSRGKLDSYSIAKYGAQTGNDSQWFPDAGNGILASTGLPITTNNPNDAQTPSTVSMQQAWVSHIVSVNGTAGNGGPRYYLTDNEPSIWQGTHQDVHPVGAKMDEILGDIESYGGMVKSVDPNALVVGPEEWGWDGYLYSGYDQQYGAAHGWSNLPDRAAHGGMDYIPYLLQQLAANNASTGKRILDILSVHYYPQSGEFSNDTSTATELLRNESTRSLWDPNYVDKSWIGTQVELIPRLKSWVSQYYPGTKIAITEYNWGAESNMNGATAQADIYGIFGREGLDYATRWTVPDPSTPTYKAMKMYRNYDGAKSGFGDTSVSDTVPNPDTLSSFAAIRSTDNALTVTVINKNLTASTPVALSIANFAGNGDAQVWQLNSSNAITRLTDITYTGSTVNITVPAESVTLLVLAPSTVKVSKPTAPTGLSGRGGNNLAAMQWSGVTGATSYNVLREVSTATTYTQIASTTSTTYYDTTAVNGTTYYYVIAAVNSAGTGPNSSKVTIEPSAAHVDTAEYNFETSTQGWTSSGGMISGVASSVVQDYKGVASLAVHFSGAAADTQMVSVSTPSTAAGKTVTFHIWVPTGSAISAVQPYVQQGAAGNWLWTGNWQSITSLTAGAWNTLTVTVPSKASTPLYSMGVQFSTSAAWTGTCYVDSVSW